MIDFKKMTIFGSTGTIALACVLGIAFNYKTSAINKGQAATYALALNSSTAVAGLSNTPSNGTFETQTQIGNTVEWSYNNAKANDSGFITLTRNYVGNTIGEEGYLVNLDPITSLESIDINYTGTDNYVTFYGSIDGTNFERIITITEPGSVTELNKYFYVKIASGEQHKNDLKITSLVFNYSCIQSDYIKDSRDGINAQTYFASAKNTDQESVYAGTIQTDVVFDTNRSSSSILWTRNLESKYRHAYLILPRTYTVEELAHSTLSFHVKADNVTLAGTSSTLIMDLFLDSFNDADKACSAFYPWYSLNSSDWQNIERDMSTIALTKNVNRIRFCANDIVTGGNLYIDDVHFYEQNTYPSFDYDYTTSTDEKDDLINDGIQNASSTITGEFSYNHISSKGDRSLKIHMNNAYNWAHLSALYNVDLSGKTVSFDYLSTDTTPQFAVRSGEGKYFYKGIEKTRADYGITLSNITGVDGNTWKHVVIVVDTLVSKGGEKTDSNYQGLRHVDAGATTYIDNLVIA